ncbi:MAG TPA: DUF4388 domain-containing protein [Ktedonobacteraceae bacterium]
MAQQREATTDRLVGIITSIKLERKSGQLWVRRGKGFTSEEGVLTFIQGQVTRARVGRRSGADALNWLSTWGQAYYIFTSPGTHEELPLSFAALPFSAPGSNPTNPVLRATQVHTDRLETEPLAAGSHHEVPRICVEFSEATTRMKRSGLPRAHRRLYLLIDGHRSISEMVPLIGRKPEEIRSMLHDLEWLGIIQMNDILS